MIIDLKIPQIFEPLFREQLIHFREIFYAGGRGSGKTTNAVNYLALKFIKEPKTNILCLREYAKSTANSVKAEFDAFFADYGFLDLGIEDGVLTYSEKKRNKETIIKVKTTTITNNINGNKIIFAGITKHTVRALKSLKGIKFCFIDESDFLGEEEYRILKPTIRAEGAQIIACFNPNSEDDYIYQLFLSTNERRYCKKVNYTENPFFPKVLDDDRKDDLATLPYPVYRHIWEGYPLENVEGVIFSKETIDLMKREPILKSFYRERYSKVIISCDPATTSKDHSNEYGVVVLGLRKSDGYVEVIDDLSENMTPEQFCSKVENAYFEYECDYVVEETNQGGDFIKHALLTKNPTLLIKEVRAVSDKVNRATPVANIASLGKILLVNENRQKLERQMKRLTNKGYLGAKGESPDRLDALVWGVYELFGISEYGTSGRTFKDSMFIDAPKGGVYHFNIGYLLLTEERFALLVFNIHGEGKNKQFNFKDCIVGDISNAIQETNALEIERVFINDCELGSLAYDLRMDYDFFKTSNDDLRTISSKVVPLMKDRICLKNVTIREENGFSDNLLRKNLINYDKNQDLENIVVRLFCEMILNEV